jgi:AcrR family transcriptional regulator
MAKATRDKQAGHEVLHIEVPAGPRKRPRQARSIMLVDALKKTGHDILEREGRDALTLNRLSERAGVAISSIYEYFPTIESLIGAIYEDYRASARHELLEHINAMPPSATLFDGILAMMQFGIATIQKWATIDPAFNIKSTHYAELVRLDLVKSENFWSAVAIPALVARFSDEVLVRDREKAAFLAFQTVLALPRAMVLGRPQYMGEPDTPVLLARMLHALLTTPADGTQNQEASGAP